MSGEVGDARKRLAEDRCDNYLSPYTCTDAGTTTPCGKCSPVSSPVAAEEWGPNLLAMSQEERDAMWICQKTSDCLCPPGQTKIGCYAPDVAAPEPVAAAPDETVELHKTPLWGAIKSVYDKHDQNQPLNHVNVVEWVEAVLAAGYLSPAEVARVVAEAKAEALEEGRLAERCGHAMNETGCEHCINPYRAALVGGPDSEQPT